VFPALLGFLGFELDVFEGFFAGFGGEVGEEVDGELDVGVAAWGRGVVEQAGFAEDDFLGVAQGAGNAFADFRAWRTSARPHHAQIRLRN